MFPILYAKNKKDILMSWVIKVENESPFPKLEIEYGQVDGKKIISHTPVQTLKRGYATLFDQAVAMARSKWIHKKDREGYAEKLDCKIESPNYPMLAKTFENGKHLSFPLYVQPKIDGLRCIASWNGNSVCLYSRTNVIFHSSSLTPLRLVLSSFFQKNPSMVLDGELYADHVPFEELSGAIRKEDSTPPFSIYYIVFDIISPQPFEDRFLPLVLPSSPLLKKLETHLVNNLEEAMTYHSSFIEKGYEGSIFRNQKGFYKKGYRSWDLQKHKDFLETEYPIVGFFEGEAGREKGSVIWECETPSGKRFRVRPRGDLEYRKELFKHANQCIGKHLTVIYQELTQDGIPRFPVGKEIRQNY